MFTDYVVFDDSDYTRMATILRGAFTIRTVDGDEDELLGDFIQALEDGIPIIPQSMENDELLLTDEIK